jgi:hypothetical protein
MAGPRNRQTCPALDLPAPRKPHPRWRKLSKKIYKSYEQFRASIVDWSDVAERAFLNSRRLA